MYYKITIEKLDFEMNTFKKSQVQVTEESVKHANFDLLEMSAVELVKKFKKEFETK